MKNSTKKILAFLLCFEMILSMACNAIPVVYAEEIGDEPVCECPMTDGVHYATCPNYTCPDCGAAEWHETCPVVDDETKADTSETESPGTEEETEETVDYSGDIGKYVQFVEEVGYYSVYFGEGDPDLDGDIFSFLYEDFEEGTVLYINDWYVDAIQGLWYQVDIYSGGVMEECAESWGDHAWVLQNYLDDDPAYNALAFLPACEICGKPDCTTEHVWCETCEKYDCGLTHTTCEICGKPDCTVEHVWCEICEKYDCGLTHTTCDICGKPDCTAEHVYCEICEKYDCGLTHTTCEICGKEDCTTEHVYCEICEDYDCGIEHVWCDKCEDYDCGLTHEACGICGKEDCGIRHVYCGVCGALDCTAEHVYCSICKDFDCGIEHEVEPEEEINKAPAVEAVIPENPELPEAYTVAILTENGTPVPEGESFRLPAGRRASLSAWSFEGEDVSYQWQVCYDKENNLWVDIGGQTGKGILFSHAMFAYVQDINGYAYIRCAVTSDSNKQVSDPIRILIDYTDYNTASASAEGARSVRSMSAGNETSIAYSLRTDSASLVHYADGVDAQAEGELEYITITINYLDANSFITGQEAEPVSSPYIASIPKGTAGDSTLAFDQTIVAPTIIGFAPFWDSDPVDGKIWTGEDWYDTDGNYTVPGTAPVGVDESASEIEVKLTKDQVQNNVVYNVYYLPIKVNVGVRYYFQNLDDDNYTEDVSRYHSDTMRTGTIVSEEYLISHAGDVSGYTRMYHQPEKVAADGSTVFRCYYDRNYYLINFTLNGGYGAEPVYDRFGASVMVGTPTLAGYTFNGWQLDSITHDDTNGAVGMTDYADRLPPTVLAQNRKYTALWKPNGDTPYTVAYWLVDDANDTNRADDTFIGTETYYTDAGKQVSGSDTLTVDSLICGLTEHTHGDGNCSSDLVCTKEVHNHSIVNGCYTLSCSKVEHTHGSADCACTVEEHDHSADCCTVTPHAHSVNCYTTDYTGPITSSDQLSDSSAKTAYNSLPSNPTNGRVYRYRIYYGNERFFFRFDGNWYYLGTSNNVSVPSGGWTNVSGPGSQVAYKTANTCSEAVHTHGDGNCVYCSTQEHTHGDGNCTCPVEEHGPHSIDAGCYTLTCEKEVHAHSAAEGCYGECAKIEHTHTDSGCKFDATQVMYMKDLTEAVSTNIVVSGDGSTVINVYYSYYKYTLRFYYARNSTSGGLEVVGGTTYPFGTYNSSTTASTPVATLLNNVTQWGKVSGLNGTKADFNATGQARVESGKYKLGTTTANGYTYYYLELTAGYTDDLEDLWPVDIFAPVTTREAHSTPHDGVNATCPVGATAYFSSWNGEYKVAYTQANSSRLDRNETIKGLYMQLDDMLVYDNVYNKFHNDTYYTKLDDGSRLVNYLGYWSNGANIKWSYPNKINYKLWLQPREGAVAAPGTTYGEITGNTTSPYANYVRYKDFAIYDDSSTEAHQTISSIRGFTHVDTYWKEIYTGIPSDVYRMFDIDFFYDINKHYTLTVNNKGVTHSVASNVAFEESLVELMDKMEDLAGEELFTDDDSDVDGDGKLSYAPPYPKSLEAGGYYFDGWYTSAACVPGTEVDLEHDIMPAGNLAIYAKWSPVHHTVRFFYHHEYLEAFEDGKTSIQHDTNGDGIPETIDFVTGNYGMKALDVLHGQTIEETKVPVLTQHQLDPDNDKMNFVNWFYIEGNQKKAYSPTEIPVKRDLNVYAEWRDGTAQPYQLNYVQNGSKIPIGESTFGYSDRGVLRTFSAKAGYPSNELYNLTTWEDDDIRELYGLEAGADVSAYKKNYNVGYFPLTSSHSFIVQEELTENWYSPKINVYNFEYVEATNVAYTVRHIYKTTGQPVIPDQVKYTDYAVVTERFVDVDGYVADSFYKELVIAVKWDPESNKYVGADSNVITFYYTASGDALYAVHHMVEKVHSDATYADPEKLAAARANYAIDGSGGYEEYGTPIQQVAPIDTPINFTPISISGYELITNAAKQTIGSGPVSAVSPNSNGTYTIIAKKAGTELYLFYKRLDYQYTVHHYKFNTTELVDAVNLPSQTFTAPYGATVTATAKLYTADKGHTRVSAEKQSIQIRQEVDQNVIIFYYSPIQYQLDYYMVPSTGGSLSLSKEVDSGTEPFTGSTATAGQGYKFIGWYTDAACTNEVVLGDTAATYTKSETGGTLIPERLEDSNGDPITTYKFYAKFELQAADFTIQRGFSHLRINQVYVYRVESLDDPSLVIYLAVPSEGEATIKSLPLGRYSVTQENGWSWRFADPPVELVEHMGETTVQFNAMPSIRKWLSNATSILSIKKGG